jgi:glycosyltransferase involved in cell wall biosynthesis
MKIHILYDFVDGPYGGGNQFLKALRAEFQRNAVYSNGPDDADIYLFNGNPIGNISRVGHLHKIRRKYPEKVCLFRLDGPTFLIRGRDRYQDLLLKGICDNYMDGIVFQSEWCRTKNKGLTGITARNETVIHNAPDRTIFNSTGRVSFSKDRQVRIIATSWSSNIRKGFEVYRYLDNNLDWSLYEMTFVGNSPVEFKNIRWVKPQPSEALAQLLRQHDIYLTASQNDPCSNSLLEALNCGLPVLALNDGGHPELIGNGGLLFEREEEIPNKLATLLGSYETFQRALPVSDISSVALRYLDFGKSVRKSGTGYKDLNWRDSLALQFRYRALRNYFQVYDFLAKVNRKLHRRLSGRPA